MRMKQNKTSYLVGGSPAALLTLAAAFVMASSADLRAAVGMSVMVIASMFLSAIVMGALGRCIPDGVRLPANLLIITGCVSLIHMLMQAHFPVAVNLLGVYLAALAASPMMVQNAEGDGEAGLGMTVRTALTTALFLAAVMIVCAVIREALGSASIWGHSIAFLEPVKVPILSGAFGGYLVTAIVMAVINAVAAPRQTEKEEDGK